MAVMALAACTQNKGTNDNTWVEQFDGTEFNGDTWCKIPAGTSPWNLHMSDYDGLYDVSDGVLTLRGIVNPGLAGEERDVITGGMMTMGRKSFGYGRLEIMAKLDGARGAWPAMWMLPDDGSRWVDGGEIDIVERLNFDDIIYTTAHTGYTQNNPEHIHSGTAKFDPTGWNVFGLEHYRDSLVWFVNGMPVYTYKKMEDAPAEQWPFDREYYLMIDMQLGGNWVGDIYKEDLPVEMKVDWVRFTEFKESE